MKNQAPRLKSTLSARNLFSGGDLLNKVAEFCNELKKLATRGKNSAENVNGRNAEKHLVDHSRDLDDKEKERKPLLQSSQVKSEATEKSYSKEKQTRKKRNDDAENTPIAVDVKLLAKLGQRTPFMVELGQSSSRRATGTPIKKLLAEEM
ncbi:unnamed protein product [Fraxinus pennsylvanica]|uniref:Uncharacterized protein n=1 Tax=Fraxinus pennsylvanica TaxID=56036 RepID=A0AAD2DVH9_9LAMI|nr:unnamed protein product [Fraxinus pennsylvanica]